MKLKNAIIEILETRDITKYGLAKQLGVEPIMIDHMISGRSKAVNPAIADNILVNYYIQLDDACINNMSPRESHLRYKKQTLIKWEK